MTATQNTHERIPKNGHKGRSICITELTEAFVSYTPGVEIIKDGSDGPSPFFVKRYKFPQQIIDGETIDGPVISFVYNHRDGWADITINKRDTEGKGSIDAVLHSIWDTPIHGYGSLGAMVRGLWNTRVLEPKDSAPLESITKETAEGKAVV